MSESQNFQLFDGNRSSSTLDMNWNALNEEKKETNTMESLSQFGIWGTYNWISKNQPFISWDNWDQVFDYVDYYDPKNAKCFDGTQLKLIIGENGEKLSVEPQLKNRTYAYCNDFFKSKLTDKIYSNGLNDTSVLTVSFSISQQNIDSVIEVYKNNGYTSETNSDLENAKIRAKRASSKAVYELNSIAINSSKLGWINCDRFLPKLPKTDFVVNVSDDINVRMVVKSFNSFYNGHNDYKNTNQQVFTKIPLGEKVTLICTAYKDDKILLAIEETKVGKKPFSTFNFEVVSKEELKNRISSM